MEEVDSRACKEIVEEILVVNAWRHIEKSNKVKDKHCNFQN